MKICLITDTHWGVRQDNISFLRHFERFYNEVFFPYLVQNNITHVIHLGDVFDRRKYVNFYTLSMFNKCFIDNLVKNNISADILIGNHDTFYKNVNDINSVKEMFKDKYHTIDFHWKPVVKQYDSLKVLLLPWIPTSDIENAKHLIKNADAKCVMAHIDINNFEVMPGHICTNGFDAALFQKYPKVFSGHYHMRQSNENIHYLGCPYQMNWGDFNYKKGFHIFDTETLKTDFIINPNDIFIKLYYDNGCTYNKESLADAYVRVVVRKKDDIVKFNETIDGIQACNPAKIQIIEEIYALSLDKEQQEKITNVHDTLSIVRSCVQEMNTSVDKSQLNTFLNGLYQEAINLDIE